MPLPIPKLEHLPFVNLAGAAALLLENGWATPEQIKGKKVGELRNIIAANLGSRPKSPSPRPVVRPKTPPRAKSPSPRPVVRPKTPPRAKSPSPRPVVRPKSPSTWSPVGSPVVAVNQPRSPVRPKSPVRSDDRKVPPFDVKRPCKGRGGGSYLKDELVEFAVAARLKTITEAKKLDKAALCDLLNAYYGNPNMFTPFPQDAPSVKPAKVAPPSVAPPIVPSAAVDLPAASGEFDLSRGCTGRTGYLKPELIEFAVTHLGMAEKEAKKMKKDELCALLVAHFSMHGASQGGPAGAHLDLVQGVDVEDFIAGLADEMGGDEKEPEEMGANEDYHISVFRTARDITDDELIQIYGPEILSEDEAVLEVYRETLAETLNKELLDEANAENSEDELEALALQHLEEFGDEEEKKDVLETKLAEKAARERLGDCILSSKLPLKEHQIRLVNHMQKKSTRGLLAVHMTGSGKCHGINTPILMYDGTVKMVQDVVVGDLLMGDDSTPRKVLSLAKGQDEMYKIKQGNGADDYVVNNAHILSLKHSHPLGICKITARGIQYYRVVVINENFGYKSKSFRIKPGQEETAKAAAEAYYAQLEKKIDRNQTHDVPLAKYLKFPRGVTRLLKGFRVGVEFPKQKCPFDPYMLGLWLGDGSSNTTAITNIDKDLIDYLKDYADDEGYDIRVSADGITYHFVSDGKVGSNKFRNFLNEYGLMKNKHIPQVFKTNDRATRLQVLAGLIDSDGYYYNGTYEISQKNKRLAADIVFMVRSLGFRCQSKEVKKSCMYKGQKREGLYQLITFSGEKLSDIPTLLSRKSAVTCPNKDQTRNAIEVEPLGRGDYYGFVLDGNHRYLLGDFTVTHNTLSLVTAAACWLGDNPTGRVYIVTPKGLEENVMKEMEAYGLDPKDPRFEFSTHMKFGLDIGKGKISCRNKMLIIDEAHMLKGEKSKTAAAVLSCAKQASKILLLTATPIMNHEIEIANAISFIDGVDPPGKTEFKRMLADEKSFRDFFKCKVSYFEVPKVDGYPTAREHEIIFEMDPDYYREYMQIEDEKISEKGGKLAKLFTGDNLSVFINGVRQASNNLREDRSEKINFVMKKIHEGGKTLVYSSFLGSGMALISQRLLTEKIPFSSINGEVSKSQRDSIVKDFNWDATHPGEEAKCKVLLISKAGGQGLDLKGTRNVILMEPGWNDGGEQQVIGRGIRYLSHVHLPPAERFVDVYHLYLAKPKGVRDSRLSADMYLREMIKEKKGNIKGFFQRLKPYTIEQTGC